MERTRQHVLGCARELLVAQGAQAVTFSAVSRAAQVSRNTLYRHWATSEQLLVDVTLRYYLEDTSQEEAGDAADPRAFLQSIRASLDAPGTTAVLCALIAQADRDPVSEQVLRQVADVRQRALIEAVGPLTDARFARVVGPLFYQALIARRPVDDAFIEVILEGLSAS
ncbi:TetR/AcrR family transcriptional regulator [Streptomyces sp. cmx-4-25]|uniref:TetR/AcrR family transcriptional regulator n=1 Tax=unclassified Streptomyces TaxID=2593676 RepID=UPI00397E9F9B